MKLHYNPKLKGLARNLRKAGNLSEALLWTELKGKKLGFRFLRQRPIGNYVVDFFCHKLKLVIEIDGVSHDSKIRKDILRQRHIEERGMCFLRFLDSDVKNNMSGVLLEIKEYITSLNPPSPETVTPPVYGYFTLRKEE